METNSFDAIVVGTGMSGGWAAKELTEKGLKTLVLDRGQMVRHGEYPTATKDPWDLSYGNRITQETRRRKYVWSRTGYPTPANELWFTDDLDNPYVEGVEATPAADTKSSEPTAPADRTTSAPATPGPQVILNPFVTDSAYAQR